MLKGDEAQVVDLSAFSGRTDLALEAHDLASPAGQAIPGVHTSSEEKDGIRISIVDITSEEGSRAIGKLPGLSAPSRQASWALPVLKRARSFRGLSRNRGRIWLLPSMRSLQDRWSG